MVDGLKPGQRKILFSCFKRGKSIIKNEIKVAQLAGYVSEHSAYHHGEASLAGTIVGMAQTFVGSNNIALLHPAGQFGTRLLGGKDAASPRYIFTKLPALTRLIFHPDDEALLEYLEDDGQKIEPKWYLPILPMVLVNGAEGIGTGWSSSVPNYNPRDVVANLRRMMDDERSSRCTRGTAASPARSRRRARALVHDLRQRRQARRDVAPHQGAAPSASGPQDYKDGVLEPMLAAGNGRREGRSRAPPLLDDVREHHTDTTVRSLSSLAGGDGARGEKKG